MNEVLDYFEILVRHEYGDCNKDIFHKDHKTYYYIHLFTVITVLGNNIPGHHWTSSKGMHFGLIQKQSIPMAEPFDINIL